MSKYCNEWLTLKLGEQEIFLRTVTPKESGEIQSYVDQLQAELKAEEENVTELGSTVGYLELGVTQWKEKAEKLQDENEKLKKALDACVEWNECLPANDTIIWHFDPELNKIIEQAMKGE